MASTAVSALAADLKAFDAYLLTRSYVSGYAPTSDDAAAIAAVAGEVDAKKFLNVARWAKHVKSFSEAERAAWPKGSGSVVVSKPAAAPASAKKEEAPKSPAKPAAAEAPAAAEEDDGDDLFESDEEADRAREEMLKAKVAAARAGKEQKEKPRQKSLIVFEIKPHEVETDLHAIANKLKTIEHAGIVNWGVEHKLLPVAYGIMKLAISVVVYDDGIDTETLEDMFMELFPDEIQSIDVAAMSKV